MFSKSWRSSLPANMAKVPADTAEELSDHNQASTSSYFQRVQGIFPGRVWSSDTVTCCRSLLLPKSRLVIVLCRNEAFSPSLHWMFHILRQNPMGLQDKAIIINSLSSLQLIFLTSDIYLKPVDFFPSFQKRELCKFLKSGHYSKNRDPKSKILGLVLCSAA